MQYPLNNNNIMQVHISCIKQTPNALLPPLSIYQKKSSQSFRGEAGCVVVLPSLCTGALYRCCMCNWFPVQTCFCRFPPSGPVPPALNWKERSQDRNGNKLLQRGFLGLSLAAFPKSFSFFFLPPGYATGIEIEVLELRLSILPNYTNTLAVVGLESTVSALNSCTVPL